MPFGESRGTRGPCSQGAESLVGGHGPETDKYRTANDALCSEREEPGAEREGTRSRVGWVFRGSVEAAVWLCGRWAAEAGRGGSCAGRRNAPARAHGLGHQGPKPGTRGESVMGRECHEKRTGLRRGPIRCHFYWDFPRPQDSRYQSSPSSSSGDSRVVCSLFGSTLHSHCI